ncbi:MAG: hypothetical protein K8I30_07170 [Anaerolineae bacterium]|nr:hypothetical protein [Anaerolineae bacterium]
MQNQPEGKIVLSWYDPEKTILLCEVKERWSWDEALAVINQMNDWCSTVQHGVYSVYHFQRNAALLPQGKTAIADVRRLINTEHPNDQLILFVGASSLVTTLVNIAGQVYGMRKIVSRFRFVQTMDEALAAIAQHKSELPRQPR